MMKLKLGLLWVILGLYRDDEKENGNYYNYGLGLWPFDFATAIIHEVGGMKAGPAPRNHGVYNHKARKLGVRV